MKMLGFVLSLTLVAAALPAFGQSDGECPEDVDALVASACPCGADAHGQAWRNHGQYVKCVVHLRNDLRKAGCLDAAAKRTIARCAARSTCGKEGAVLCCLYDTSATCSDATPGDGTKDGFCGDSELECDGDADCATVLKGPKVLRRADRCTARGWTVVGTGSACSECPPLPPAP